MENLIAGDGGDPVKRNGQVRSGLRWEGGIDDVVIRPNSSLNLTGFLLCPFPRLPIYR
jgi:hypothetical protein